jgi:glucose/arabinose dehydrogenase
LLLEPLEERSVPSVLAGADSLYIGDAGDNTVKQFDATTGKFEGTFVAMESGGLHGPRGLIFDREGNLLVANQNVNLPIPGDILRFDGTSGAFDNVSVPATDPNGPFAPRGIVLGPNNILYIADIVAPDNMSDGKVEEYRYDAETGTAAFKADILHPAAFSGEFHPRGIVFGPDGMLYVSTRNIPSGVGGAVLRFNPTSGAYLGAFVSSNSTNDLNRPEGIVFGPDGNLYVTSFPSAATNTTDTDKVLIFAGPRTSNPGALLGEIQLDQAGGPRAFAQALLFGPDGSLYVPITGGDKSFAGTVRRYDAALADPSFGTFTVFISSAHLVQPWYLTFGNTDPATLDYVAETSVMISPTVPSSITSLAPSPMPGGGGSSLISSSVSPAPRAVTLEGSMSLLPRHSSARDQLFANLASDLPRERLQDDLP